MAPKMYKNDDYNIPKENQTTIFTNIIEDENQFNIISSTDNCLTLNQLPSTINDDFSRINWIKNVGRAALGITSSNKDLIWDKAFDKEYFLYKYVEFFLRWKSLDQYGVDVLSEPRPLSMLLEENLDEYSSKTSAKELAQRIDIDLKINPNNTISLEKMINSDVEAITQFTDILE